MGDGKREHEEINVQFLSRTAATQLGEREVFQCALKDAAVIESEVGA